MSKRSESRFMRIPNRSRKQMRRRHPQQGQHPLLPPQRGGGESANKGKGKGKGKGGGKGNKAKPPKPPATKDSSGVQSGQRPACFFYPKGTCTRGKDCPFEHVDAPKKAAPPKARALATSLHPNVRGFRATCRLITAPFRVFARFAAAFSFALPATVHHSHDRIAATVSRPNCSGGSYFLD